MGERNRCPVCGHEFDLDRAAPDRVFACPAHKPTEVFTADELIGPDDDCVYDI